MNLLSFASVLSCIVLVLQTPPQGSIEGSVTQLGTGQPVANARVTVSLRPGQPGARGAAPLRRSNPSSPIQPVFTDAKGNFLAAGLSDGVYNVLVQANGYVGRRYGRFPNGTGTPVTVAAGQASKSVNVALTPAANIAGQVRDTSHQPLINVPVELLRYSYDDNGRRMYESVGVTQTNDHGEYRMYWVTPGRYYLRAGSYSTGGSPHAVPSFLVDGFGIRTTDAPAVCVL
jgi:hypothetical protein